MASVAVKDLKTAVQWYEKLLGRSPDSTPLPEVAEWEFPDGGWLQVYALSERAGRSSCTLAVSNLEEESSRLRGLGIDTGGRISSAEIKAIMIKDPDGNSIALTNAVHPRTPK